MDLSEATASLPADAPLPAALVQAYLSQSVPRTRAAMPSDRGGRPRTEEVRAALTRMMVDDGYYLDHRVQVLALLAECGVGYPIDGLPLPSYVDADLAANGFANLPPDELALIALDPDVLDSVGRLVRWDIPQGDAGGLTLGDWHRAAEQRYAAE